MSQRKYRARSNEEAIEQMHAMVAKSAPSKSEISDRHTSVPRGVDGADLPIGDLLVVGFGDHLLGIDDRLGLQSPGPAGRDRLRALLEAGRGGMMVTSSVAYGDLQPCSTASRSCCSHC